ncbi:hypothetical protein KA078_00440 [Candidatus Woesebacteria bacterium]|nr:hypothetical protein [Candidatus Woesebacteria bacterium]
MNKLKYIVFILLLFILWRSALQFVATQVDGAFPYAPTFPYSQTLLPQYSAQREWYSWANFDGVHYLTIAEKGYAGAALIQAFFPLFPLSMIAVGQLTHNYLVSGLLVSHIAAVVSIFLLLAVLRPYAPRPLRFRTLVLLFVFPTSFYLVGLYTESLFLALTLGAFYFGYRKQWLWATLCAGLVAATRVVGLAVVIALLVEYAAQKKWKLQKSDIPHLLLISLGSLGLVGYMAYLYFKFDDPLLFLHVQSQFGAGRQDSVVLLPQVLWRGVKILLYSDMNLRWWTSLQELLYTLLFFGTLIYGYLKKMKLPLSWLVFSIISLMLPTLTGNLSSMPRYALVIFPVFFIWAQQKLSWPKWLLIFGIFTVGLVLNTILFLQGYWVA